MDAKEFAEQYADHVVIVHGTDLPFGGTGPDPHARVVGYNQDDLTAVIVEFEDETDRMASWPMESNPFTLCVEQDSFKDPPHAWSVTLTELEVIGKRGKASNKTYDLNPYPIKCKVCKSMARKICGVIYCSNIQCKTRSKRPKLSNGPKTHLLRCPKCKAKAVQWTQTKNQSGLVVNMLSCFGGHRWQQEPKVNDLIASSLVAGNKTDVIYTSQGWVAY